MDTFASTLLNHNKMNKTLILALTFTTLVACTDSKEDKYQRIVDLEQSDELNSTEGLAKLAKMHQDYGMEYADAEANNYLYAAAQFYYYENKFGDAKPLLSEYIKRDDSTERYRNAALNLANIYSVETDFDNSDQLITAVLDKEIPTPAQWQDIIKLYQDKITAKIDVKPTDYERLSLAFVAVGRYGEATSSLDTAITKFPDYEKRNNLIYRAGFVNWEFAKNTDLAKKYYEYFLAEYPEDDKADDVKQILNSGMLKMSNEEILDMLKGKGN